MSTEIKIYRVNEVVWDRQHNGLCSSLEYSTASNICYYLNLLLDSIQSPKRSLSYEFHSAPTFLMQHIKKLRDFLPDNIDQVRYSVGIFNHSCFLISESLNLIIKTIELNEEIKSCMEESGEYEGLMLKVLEGNRKVCECRLDDCFSIIKSLYPIEYFK